MVSAARWACMFFTNPFDPVSENDPFAQACLAVSVILRVIYVLLSVVQVKNDHYSQYDSVESNNVTTCCNCSEALGSIQNVYYITAASMIIFGNNIFKQLIWVIAFLGHIWNGVDGVSGFVRAHDLVKQWGYDEWANESERLYLLYYKIISCFVNLGMFIFSIVYFSEEPTNPKNYGWKCYAWFALSMGCGAVDSAVALYDECSSDNTNHSETLLEPDQLTTGIGKATNSDDPISII